MNENDNNDSNLNLHLPYTKEKLNVAKPNKLKLGACKSPAFQEGVGETSWT